MVQDLDNQRLLQLWMYSAQAEHTLEASIEIAKQHGYSGLLIKSLDGVTWMGHIDPWPDAIRSTSQAAEQKVWVNNAGLLYCLWTNPLYYEDSRMIDQAHMTADLANVADALFLDVEPYPQFWGANRPTGKAAGFMFAIRERAPDAYIVLQPDPRPARFRELRPEEWLPHVNAISGQHYWSDFGTTPESLTRALEMRDLYNLPVYPTLPGNAPVDQLSRAVELLTEWEITGYVAWRLGSMSAEQLAIVGQGQSDPEISREEHIANAIAVTNGWNARLLEIIEELQQMNSEMEDVEQTLREHGLR